MKATLKDGSIVEVKTGLDWGLEFDITMMDPDGFYPRDRKAVGFHSLMTEIVYLKCIAQCTCQFGSKFSMDIFDKIKIDGTQIVNV